MESHTEIVLEVDTATESEPALLEEPVARALPFSFAKRHGVLIRDISDGAADTVYRTGASPLSLAEARRFAGVPLRLTRVTADAFDDVLQQTYEQGSHKAMQMVGDLDEHTDLLQVAQDPAMLAFLDAGVNVKGSPNENFAREIMELFSMGVGNYTEQDIREAARAFTGWNFQGLDFVVNAADHDAGAKAVMSYKVGGST